MTNRALNGGLRGPAFALVGLAALFAATSCGGGGSGSVPGPRSTATRPGGSGGQATAQFIITWPNASAASNRRRRDYLSNSTKSVTIVVNGTTTTEVDNPNLAAGATGGTKTTTVNVNAPTGMDTFLVSDYDALGGSGNLLAQNSIPFDVVLDAANVVSITLNGNLNKIACAGVAPFVSGTSPLTLVGPAGQIAVLPEDAGGNVIITPGAVPGLTLAPADSTKATVTTTSVANTFNLNVLAAAGTTVSLTGSGQNLVGATVTGTCTVTRQLALYVVNHVGGSVSIFPASATTSGTPVATIAGSNTQLVSAQFVAVDPKGDIFVSNLGPAPNSSATFGPTSGYVSIYGPGPGSVGSPAPIATIPALNIPEGLAFDAGNKLYVLSIDRVSVYPPTADGVTGPAAPSSVIAAPSPPATAAPSPSASPLNNQTDLFSCYGMAVGGDGQIYTACSNVLNIFPAGSSGNVAPAEIESVGTTGMTFSSHSWLDVGVDASGNIYAPASNNNLNFVETFAPGSGANPAATPAATVAKSSGFSQPLGIFVDPNNAVYVANYGNNTVNAFASMATLEAGVAGATFSTGVNGPYGVYVR